MSVSTNLKFNDILIRAVNEQVSDLHLSVGSVIKSRIDGKLVDWEGQLITQEFLEENIIKVLNERQTQEFAQNGSIVFSHNFINNLRFRTQLLHQEGKLSARLRFIPSSIKSVGELGLPKIIEQIMQVERGLVIVSGVSGAGKTTSIAAMIEYINQTVNKSIITLEQPIEFIFVNNKSLIEQREILIDTPSYNQATGDMLSSDVGVVVISRLSGADSASNILELAAKCLVILEISSQDMISTIEDFLSVFDPFNPEVKLAKQRVLSYNLIAVINQMLVTKKGGGRLPVIEILHNNTATATAITEGRLARIPEIIISSGHEGMISKERSLAEMVKAEQVSLDEALRHVNDKDGFKEMILK